jgi:hypothetical protein
MIKRGIVSRVKMAKNGSARVKKQHLNKPLKLNLQFLLNRSSKLNPLPRIYGL